MKVKFLVDTQLPPKLCKFLSLFDCDAIHTTDFPNGHLMDDQLIAKIAANEDRIIITKDSDFYDSYILKGPPPKILLLKFGNISNKDLMQNFNSNIEVIVESFNSGTGMVIFESFQLTEYQ